MHASIYVDDTLSSWQLNISLSSWQMYISHWAAKRILIGKLRHVVMAACLYIWHCEFVTCGWLVELRIIYAYIYIYMYIYIHVCVCVHTNTFRQTLPCCTVHELCEYTCIYVYAYIQMRRYIFIYLYIRIYTLIYIHSKCMHVFICLCMRILLGKLRHVVKSECLYICRRHNWVCDTWISHWAANYKHLYIWYTSMYIYIHIYIYIYIYICVYVYIYIYIYVYIYICVYIYIWICMYICT